MPHPTFSQQQLHSLAVPKAEAAAEPRPLLGPGRSEMWVGKWMHGCIPPSTDGPFFPDSMGDGVQDGERWRKRWGGHSPAPSSNSSPCATALAPSASSPQLVRARSRWSSPFLPASSSQIFSRLHVFQDKQGVPGTQTERKRTDRRAHTHGNQPSAPLARSTVTGEGHVQGVWSQRPASSSGLIDTAPLGVIEMVRNELSGRPDQYCSNGGLHLTMLLEHWPEIRLPKPLAIFAQANGLFLRGGVADAHVPDHNTGRLNELL